MRRSTVLSHDEYEDEDDNVAEFRTLLPTINDAAAHSHIANTPRINACTAVRIAVTVVVFAVIVVIALLNANRLRTPQYRPPTTVVNGRRVYPLNTHAGSASADCDLAFACFVNASRCAVSAAVLLHCFFQAETLGKPHALTLRPSVDCIRGRYLYLATDFADGLGSVFAYYNTIAAIADMINATIVDSSAPTISHSGDIDSDVFGWQQWHIARDDYLACPLTAPVRSRIVDLGEYGFANTNEAKSRTRIHRFDARTNASYIDTDIVRSINTALRTVDDELGWTIAMPSVYPWTTSFQQTNMIHALRWAATSLTHRHEDESSGVIQRACTRYESSCLSAVVHIRRGDIVEFHNGEVYFKDFAFYRPRIVTSEAMIQLITATLNALSNDQRRRIDWMIVSEGHNTQHISAVIDVIRFSGARSITTQLNGASSDVIRLLADADILFVSPSFLSFTAGVLNPLMIKVGSDKLQFARFHGMRQFIPATLTRSSDDRADSEYYQITRESDIHQTFVVSEYATARFVRLIQDAIERRQHARTLIDRQGAAWTNKEDADVRTVRLAQQKSFVREIVAASQSPSDMFNTIPSR